MYIKYIELNVRDNHSYVHSYINVLLTLAWRHTCIQREVRTENE